MLEIEKDLNALTEIVIGKCIEAHRSIGPGLLEFHVRGMPCL